MKEVGMFWMTLEECDMKYISDMAREDVGNDGWVLVKVIADEVDKSLGFEVIKKATKQEFENRDDSFQKLSEFLNNMK